MCLLVCRSSRHKATDATLVELYFGQDLCLSTDLLRDSVSGEKKNLESDYILALRGKLDVICYHAEQHIIYSLHGSRIIMIKRLHRLFFYIGQKVVA